eukprot:CAMPEP_0177760378 /NCGR_PEP_ID=MMETSP0491_2-20121128/5236_1 /TAXON_ID=63592 /ORGANISM="Tetraselmis chuii, Strain PLY429" /LENGTH=92 /DNA_ID=CAMNT_0019276275 /DNA_START=738 /DNA_END=1013 /DNA_ORIENTATION=+
MDSPSHLGSRAPAGGLRAGATGGCAVVVRPVGTTPPTQGSSSRKNSSIDPPYTPRLGHATCTGTELRPWGALLFEVRRGASIQGPRRTTSCE